MHRRPAPIWLYALLVVMLPACGVLGAFDASGRGTDPAGIVFILVTTTAACWLVIRCAAGPPPWSWRWHERGRTGRIADSGLGPADPTVAEVEVPIPRPHDAILATARAVLPIPLRKALALPSVAWIDLDGGALCWGSLSSGQRECFGSIPIAEIRSIAWDVGQATARTGWDCDDWSLLVSHGKTGIATIGPPGPRSRIEPFGLAVIDLLARAGVSWT